MEKKPPQSKICAGLCWSIWMPLDSEFQLLEIFFDTSVVNTKELVGASHHVNAEVFAFRSLFVKKLEHGIVKGRCSHDTGHDLK